MGTGDLAPAAFGASDAPVDPRPSFDVKLSEPKQERKKNLQEKS
jgi:hypothetical protein